MFSNFWLGMSLTTLLYSQQSCGKLGKMLLPLVFCVLLIPQPLFAIDIVKMPKRIVPDNVQLQFMSEVIETALILTEDEYGPYEVAPRVPAMIRDRLVHALEKGEKINVYISPLKAEFVGKVHIVPIPIRRGILNYRLALIHKDDLRLFAKINTPAKFRELSVGMYTNSATLSLLEAKGYDIVEAPTHESMFPMLVRKRFQYAVRGVHEVFYELANRKAEYPELVIEPTIAINIPMPTVVYVSLKYPRLVERLDSGLRAMALNGVLKDIFNRYYRNYAKEAKLDIRKVFHVENPLTDVLEFPAIPGLWFSPQELEEGAITNDFPRNGD